MYLRSTPRSTENIQIIVILKSKRARLESGIVSWLEQSKSTCVARLPSHRHLVNYSLMCASISRHSHLCACSSCLSSLPPFPHQPLLGLHCCLLLCVPLLKTSARFVHRTGATPSELWFSVVQLLVFTCAVQILCLDSWNLL